MSDGPQLLSVYLKPGELCIENRPTVVSTVLGSCVAVTMYSPQKKVGAICHAVLPTGDGSQGFKYLNCAMDYMLDYFAGLKVQSSEIQLKLFGGAGMFEKRFQNLSKPSVGRQNILAAMQIFEKERLRPIVSDVGGFQGRKILFYTHSGEVLLKRLKKRELFEFEGLIK